MVVRTFPCINPCGLMCVIFFFFTQEKEELKGKVAKQNNAIQKLERRLQILEGKKLVDPVHLRKDQQPCRSPLRQGECI